MRWKKRRKRGKRTKYAKSRRTRWKPSFPPRGKRSWRSAATRFSPAWRARIIAFLWEATCSPGAAQDDIARAASALFASAARLTVHDAKAFYALGLPVSQNIFDTKLAAYAINPQLGGGFSLQAACGQVDVPCDPAAPTADMSALRQRQEERMRADGVEGVFSRIEMPLCAVLNDMEHAGFLVDGQELARLGEQYRAKLSELTARIYELAGESFNINSPKQLGELLFEKMGLPGGKKTQRGYSTDAQVLESLAGQFEIAAQILNTAKMHG